GCGGGGGSTPAFTSMCRGSGPGRTLLSGLRASPVLDGAVMRTERAFPRLTAAPGGDQGADVVNPDEPADGWSTSTGETVGTLCAKASSSAACLEKVE